MEPWELHAWYQDYIDVCNRHDLDEIRARLAPDVRRAHLPAGADAWVDAVANLFAAFPDYQWKLVTVVAEEDRIAAHLRARGTHRGTFEGLPATGRHVNIAEFAVYRLVGGRIAEYAGTVDHAELHAQLQG
jgi:steroid delta-isomerase-like uncharacterized protein